MTYLEIAEIDVRPGTEGAFEGAVGQAAPLFQRAVGCRSFELHRSVEIPGRYRLLVEWTTVDDHLVAFRESEDFQTWRELVSEYFAAAPRVEHQARVLKSF